MSFLLDTDICSAYLRNHPLVSNRFVQYGGQLHTTIITFAELQVWAKRKKASAKLLQSVLDMRQVVYVLPIDDSIAEKFGDIRAGRLDVGLHAPPMDMLNAATALVLLRAGREYGSITLEADARHLLTDVWTSAGVIPVSAFPRAAKPPSARYSAKVTQRPGRLCRKRSCSI